MLSAPEFREGEFHQTLCAFSPLFACLVLLPLLGVGWLAPYQHHVPKKQGLSATFLTLTPDSLVNSAGRTPLDFHPSQK